MLLQKVGFWAVDLAEENEGEGTERGKVVDASMRLRFSILVGGLMSGWHRWGG